MNITSKLPRIIVAVSILLALMGVIMVFSSSAFQTKRPRQLESPGMLTEQTQPAMPILPLIQRSSPSAYSTFLFFARQLVWTGFSIAGMLLVSHMDYPRWKSLSRPLVLVAVAGLLLVWSPLGITSNGATSWIRFPRFTIQPAEFAKVVLVIFLADLYSRKQTTVQSSFIGTVLLFLMPITLITLIAIQPDLGMAALMLAMTCGIWFLAGAKLRHLLLLTGVAAALFTFICLENPNARRRLDAFFKPEEASAASRYQIEQAKITIAKGGLWGVGLGDGQQKMHFLPAPHTDFIFAVMAEELGFVTCILVLLAYGILITAGFLTSIKAPDLFGSLLAGGLTLMLALGVLINIAVVTGSMPTTGLPLPLMSYGGSSLISSMLAIGMIVNVSRNLEGVRKN